MKGLQGEVQCPVCSESVADPPLHVYTAAEAASHFCPPSRSDDRHRCLLATVRRLWGGDSSSVHVCPSCGFGFGWPYVGGDDEYYGILHEQAGYPKDRWEYGWTKRQVLPQFLQGGRILDIGTGSGMFLRGLDSKWEKFATEGSPANRQRLRAGGIECFESTSAAVAEARGTFAVITMFQVLEHIAPFRGILSDCQALLQSGGMIVISVPSAAAIYDQEVLTGCPDMTPNHINKWTPDSLAVALRQHGFDPQAAVVEPPSLEAATSRAALMTRAQAASNPQSLAARAYGIRGRFARVGLLVGLSAINLVTHLGSWRRLSVGVSFVASAVKPPAGNAR
jgi:SAM-dependent methyltransferase